MVRKYVFNVHRSLVVLNYLENIGTWENLSRIKLGSGNFNPAEIQNILNDLMIKNHIESRPAENPQAKIEYRITDSGRKINASSKEFLAKF